MILIRKMKSLFKIILQRIKWQKDSKELKSVTYKQITPDNFHGKTILLIPHADDEWIGCSQLITNQEREVILCYADMPGGDTTEIHQKRYYELLSVANRYHRKLVTLGTDNAQRIGSLITLIKTEEPVYLGLPFYYDWHNEHIEVMKILYGVLGQLNAEKHIQYKILMYQVSVPIPVSLMTDCCAMTKNEFQKKWTVFKNIYKSQLKIPWKRFGWNEYINGACCKSYAAEVFVTEDAFRWMQNMQTNLLEKDEVEKIYNNLQDLKAIRELIERNFN